MYEQRGYNPIKVVRVPIYSKRKNRSELGIQNQSSIYVPRTHVQMKHPCVPMRTDSKFFDSVNTLSHNLCSDKSLDKECDRINKETTCLDEQEPSY